MGGYESISQNTASNALGHEEKFYKAIVGAKTRTITYIILLSSTTMEKQRLMALVRVFSNF